MEPVGYVGGAESEADAGDGVRREAGFSTFHIRRGDFQYTKVSRVLVLGVEAVYLVRWFA